MDSKHLVDQLRQLKDGKTDSIDTSEISRDDLIELLKFIVSQKLPLKKLSIDLYFLDDIPSDIYKITSLEYLNLSYGSRVEEISPYIRKLSHLKHLSFSDLGIKTIPKAIYSLVNLESLILDGNQITNIDNDISKLKKLNTLDLSDNSIRLLPDSIWTLGNLKKLSLDNNPLIYISNKVNNAHSLEHLTISGGILSSSEDAISALNKVKYIIYKDRNAKEIPENISLLNKISQLIIDGSEIYELPISISKLLNLKILNIDHNSANCIPKNIDRIPNLEYLRAFGSEIKELPEFLFNTKSLREIHLSHNNLTELPKSISNLSKLEVVDISSNNISNIPNSITELTNLHTLNIDNNPIVDLPIKLATLPKLRQLIYDSGRISENSPYKHLGLKEIAASLEIENREKIYVSLLRLPESIKTAFQRYFVAFDEFWRDATGKEINFKVNKIKDGLEIEVELIGDVTVEEVEEKLNDYFYLIKRNKENYYEKFKAMHEQNQELSVQNIALEVKATKLEVRVQQLEQDLKLAALEDKQTVASIRELLNDLPTDVRVIKLTSENETLWKLLEIQASKPLVLLNNNNENTVNNNITIDIKLDIEILQDSFDIIKETLPDKFKGESQGIQNELDNKKDSADLQSDTGLKNRIKRLLSKVKTLDNIKNWVSNLKSISEDTPQIFNKVKEALGHLSEYGQKIGSSDIVKHINEILEQMGAQGNG